MNGIKEQDYYFALFGKSKMQGEEFCAQPGVTFGSAKAIIEAADRELARNGAYCREDVEDALARTLDEKLHDCIHKLRAAGCFYEMFPANPDGVQRFIAASGRYGLEEKSRELVEMWRCLFQCTARTSGC